MRQNKTKQNIAIFDLDETLTKKGTWGRFVASTMQGRPLKWIPFLITSLFRQALYVFGLAPREHVKESMMRRTISGKSREELQKLAEDFAKNEVSQGLRARSLQMIEKHRARGDRIIIASAAVDLLVEPIAKRLGVDEIVCTKMAWENGRLGRKLGGMNCYGKNKLFMIKQYLKQDKNFRRDKVHITVYSDSSSDIPILCWADKGIAVNPSPKLLKQAAKYGFEIQDWDLEANKEL